MNIKVISLINVWKEEKSINKNFKNLNFVGKLLVDYGSFVL